MPTMLRTNKKFRKIAEEILSLKNREKGGRKTTARAAEKKRINSMEADEPGKNDNNTGGVANG